MFAPFDAVTGIAYDLVTGLTYLDPLTGGLAAAIAIIVFTAAVRLGLLPLSLRQARADRIRRRLTPEVERLRKRHRTDPVRAHKEITALYRAEGTSMWAGIGPSLLQLPVFTVVYRMFLSPAIGGHANLLLAHTLFGTPLGQRWLFTAGAFGPHGWVFMALFTLLAALAWRTSHRMRDQPTTPLARLMRVLPFGTVLVAAYVPLAAGLYLLTTTTWTAAERAILWRTPTTT